MQVKKWESKKNWAICQVAYTLETSIIIPSFLKLFYTYSVIMVYYIKPTSNCH